MERKTAFSTAVSAVILIAGLALTAVSADYMNRTIKEIESEKPFYLKRTSAQWEKMGRVIGEVKNTPKSFTIEIRQPGVTGIPKVLKADVFTENLMVYETSWLGPGTYDLVFKSEGYVEHVIKGVTIKPYSDCVINVLFGLTEYRR